MPTEDEMTVTGRRKYLKRMKPLYAKTERSEQSRMLTEMEQVTGLHRKSLLRPLHAPTLERKKREKGRRRTYGLAVEQVILVVWESLDYICAERLTPALLSTAQHLAGFDALHLSQEVEKQLAEISEATVTRILSKYRMRKQRLPQKGPERANHIRKPVPMKRIPWETSDPGHFEVDLVHHSGESTDGIYVHTLQMIDVATGWSERVAVLGKGQPAMEGGFRSILARLPFPVKELHPDNGSEFFNNHLVRFWGEAITGLTLSRSRPYQKNDLQEKICLGDHVLRHWDQAQTPYERLLATGMLSAEQQTRLQALYEQTNPMALRNTMYRQLAALWDIPASASHVA